MTGAVSALLEYLTDDERTELDALLTSGTAAPLAQYQHDPLGFLTDVLGIERGSLVWSEAVPAAYARHKADGTPDPLATIARALADGHDVGVESGTGTGKSFTAAGLILWFLASWQGARVFTFAPKEDQLRKYIWTEIGKLWPRFQAHFPAATLTDLTIRMLGGTDESWGAWGYSVGVRAGEQSATKAQGMHAEHMLLVYEETPGIPHAVLEAGENTCTAPHNLRLALGNPDNQYDALHRFCTSPGVVHVRVSALDHPNVVTGREIVPGAVSTRSIARRAAKSGEDSPRYKSRVRGISPEESADSLIRKVWIDRAVSRWRAWQASGARALPGMRAKGVDVARSENGDQAAIADFEQAVCAEVVAFPCPNVVHLGQRVYAEMAAQGVAPECVGIDPVGVGGGTVDTVNELLLKQRRVVTSLSGSAAPGPYLKNQDGTAAHEIRHTHTTFGNLRAQMAWQLAHDLQFADDIGLPDDPELHEELLALKAEDRNGKTYLIEKDELREALGRSPNKADAVMYGNWVRLRATVAPSRGVRGEDTDQTRVTGAAVVLEPSKNRDDTMARMMADAQRRMARGTGVGNRMRTLRGNR